MDTNGAGDAFVGGEITELISLKRLAEKMFFVGWYRSYPTYFPNVKIEFCYKYGSEVSTS